MINLQRQTMSAAAEGSAPPTATVVLAANASADDSRERDREVLLNMLLPFQRALVADLLQEDGLCVLAPGIGLHQVVAVLLRLQDARLRGPSQRGVVLVLGAAPWQRDALRRELARIDPVASGLASGAGSSGSEGMLGEGGRGVLGLLGWSARSFIKTTGTKLLCRGGVFKAR